MALGERLRNVISPLSPLYKITLQGLSSLICFLSIHSNAYLPPQAAFSYRNYLPVSYYFRCSVTLVSQKKKWDLPQGKTWFVLHLWHATQDPVPSFPSTTCALHSSHASPRPHTWKQSFLLSCCLSCTLLFQPGQASSFASHLWPYLVHKPVLTTSLPSTYIAWQRPLTLGWRPPVCCVSSVFQGFTSSCQ